MKFTIGLVMLALLAGCTYSSLAPLSYTAVHGPTLLQASPGLVLAQPHAFAYHAAPAAVAYHAAPAAVAYHAAPAAVAYHAEPAPLVISSPLVAAEGTYIAKTKGAVHIAPLPGHANSASSINLESAPGTI